MKGWFDAFRNDGGPTLYNFNNRTAVTGDITIIIFLTIFCTLYVAFLIVFPGVRKERFSTFFSVTLSLLVGATILVSMFGSGWHEGSSKIASIYTAFSMEKIQADLGIFIGLGHVNVTLQGCDANGSTDIDFNERFMWQTSDKMGTTFRKELMRGLPFPILTVAEYFSLGQEGLSWGGQYRAAGYVATIFLWASLVTWLLMNLMLVVVPRYGALLMALCGVLLISTVLAYLYMLPEAPMVIHLEGSAIHLHLGWCFWLVTITGCICLFSGLVITMVEVIYPHSFSTILEVNYDTPYDRHIIIEDSHGRRFQKKRSSNNSKLEEPISVRSRILRRLSSKTREEKLAEKQGLEDLACEIDVSNKSRQMYELEPPSKSPWRYPHPPVPDASMTARNNALNRSLSEDSIRSNMSRNLSPNNKNLSSFLITFRLKGHPNNLPEVSMW